MNDISIMSTFLVVFREALEASLIIGIILAVLSKLNAGRYFPHVIFSACTALVFSFVIGLVTMNYFQTAEGAVKEWTEATISVLACGVLTYMVVWMDKQARSIRPEIETKMEAALSAQDLFFIISMPFLAVLREGVETVLFLSAVANQSSGTVSTAGGVLGFILGVGIVFAIFAGGKKIPLRPLFRSTGLVLIFMAAGLLAYGIHEFHEIGVIPEIIAPIYNINHILNEKQGVGLFLKALFGYNGNPSLVEVSAYLLYVTPVLLWFFKKNNQPVLAAK